MGSTMPIAVPKGWSQPAGRRRHTRRRPRETTSRPAAVSVPPPQLARLLRRRWRGVPRSLCRRRRRRRRRRAPREPIVLLESGCRAECSTQSAGTGPGRPRAGQAPGPVSGWARDRAQKAPGPRDHARTQGRAATRRPTRRAGAGNSAAYPSQVPTRPNGRTGPPFQPRPGRSAVARIGPDYTCPGLWPGLGLWGRDRNSGGMTGTRTVGLWGRDRDSDSGGGTGTLGKGSGLWGRDRDSG